MDIGEAELVLPPSSGGFMKASPCHRLDSQGDAVASQLESK